MQNIDLSTIPNPNGWAVVHNQEDNLFYVRSEKGHYLQGAYTSRKMAERRMYDYLVNASKAAAAIRQAKNK